MRHLVASILICWFVNSCKKTTVTTADAGAIYFYDTIKPRSFYPALPGSYWKYKSKCGNGSLECVVTSTVGADYSLYEFKGVKTFVPLVDGSPIYGYDRITLSSDYFISPTRNTFLSEKVGDEFWEDYPRVSHYVDRFEGERMRVTGTYTNSSGTPVLQVKGSFYWKPSNPGVTDLNTVTYREYTKNIGMTFYSKVDTVTNDTLSRLSLFEYRIGK